MNELKCRNIISANLKAPLVFSNEPVSFVGGVNILEGVVSDYRHPNYKENITGKIFAFPHGKGSSSAGLVLMEMMRIGTAPKAIINIRTDPVLLTAPLILKNFYKQILPVINLSEEDFLKLDNVEEVEIFEDNNIIKLFYKN